MKHASLFSGIGGFDLAAEWIGWENVFQVEIDDFCQKVLTKNFPNVTRYRDIKEFDGTKYRGTIDIISGGFPCQPFSIAGKRKGTEDDRYLWNEMLRTIRQIQPNWIVGENVYGIINWSRGLVFEQVQIDLENEGFEIQSYILPACAVNAPHRRDRVWFVAYSKCNTIAKQDRKSFEIKGTRETINDKGIREQFKTIQYNGLGNILQSSTNSIGKRKWKLQSTIKGDNTSKVRDENSCGFNVNVKNEFIADSHVGRFKECWPKWFTSREFTQDYGLASKPGIRRGNDGFSYRADRLKSLGNAIVPQITYEIFKVINQIENL